MEKKKKGFISVIAACVIIAIGAGLFLYNPIETKETNITIEYGEKITNDVTAYLGKNADKEDIKKTNIEIYQYKEKKDKFKKIEADKIDSFEVGEYKAVLSTKWGPFSKEKTVNIEIKDTIAPEFNKTAIAGIETIETVDIDFSKYITASDLSEFKVTLDTDKVDLNKTGEYKIKAVAEDIYGNKTEKKITVVVKEKPANMTGSTINVDEETGKVTVEAETYTVSSYSSKSGTSSSRNYSSPEII